MKCSPISVRLRIIFLIALRNINSEQYVGEQDQAFDQQAKESFDRGKYESPSLVLVINDTKLLMPCV